MSGRRVVEGPLGGEVSAVTRSGRPAAIQWYGSGRGTPCSVCSKGSRGAVGGRGASAAVTGVNVLAGVARRCGCCSPAAWRSAAGAVGRHAAAARDEREGHASPSAMLNEVDSFNPFLGIEAASYEMWALIYDYLITYSTEGHVARAGAGDQLGDLGRRAHLDLRHPRRASTWSDGEPLTAADIAYTYNRILDGGPEAATWGSYLEPVDRGDRARRDHLVLELKKPNAVLPLLPIPIVPEHVWKDVGEKEVKTLHRTSPRTASRWSAPVRSGSWRAARAARRTGSRRTPTTGRARRTSTRWSSASTRREDPVVQALIKGEVDFVDGHHRRSRSRRCRARRASRRRTATRPASTRSRSTPAPVDTETGEPDRRRQPGAPGPGFPARPRLRHRPRGAASTRSTRAPATPGQTIIPPAYTTCHWEPPEDEAFTYDPERAGELLDEAGYAMGDDGLRTMPDGVADRDAAALRAGRSRPTSLDTMKYFKEWLDDLGIEAEVTSDGVQQAHRHHPRRRLRRLPVGLVRRAGPRPRCSAT